MKALVELDTATKPHHACLPQDPLTHLPMGPEDNMVTFLWKPYFSSIGVWEIKEEEEEEEESPTTHWASKPDDTYKQLTNGSGVCVPVSVNEGIRSDRSQD